MNVNTRGVRGTLWILAALLGGMLHGPLSAAPEFWLEEINQLTAADKTSPPPERAVVFVGSSSIRMWTTLAEDFPGCTSINRGFGGSELADSLFYFDRIVAPYRPRVVVLYAGDNDVNAGKTAEQVLADFQAFWKKLRATLPETRLVFLSIKESPVRAHLRDEMRRANALIAAECAKDPRCKFVDVAAALMTDDGAFRADLFEADGLHMTRAGYAAWTKVVAPALAE